MNVLLDTHVFLWWVTDDPNLSTLARQVISDANSRILFSVVSGWEIAIKVGTGKLTLPDPPEVYVPDRVQRNRFEILPILLPHALRTSILPMHHRDPFDRLLVAQSLVEGVPILTADTQITPYGVSVIW